MNLAFVAGKKTDESFCMKEIYAMRRANGDWFALEGHGRLCVPLFLNSHDALMSRLRNFGMQLFEPVALDAQLLKDVAPAGAAGNVDFCLVEEVKDIMNKPNARKPNPAYIFTLAASVVVAKYPIRRINETSVKKRPMMKLSSVSRLDISIN